MNVGMTCIPSFAVNFRILSVNRKNTYLLQKSVTKHPIPRLDLNIQIVSLESAPF